MFHFVHTNTQMYARTHTHTHPNLHTDTHKHTRTILLLFAYQEFSIEFVLFHEHFLSLQYLPATAHTGGNSVGLCVRVDVSV